MSSNYTIVTVCDRRPIADYYCLWAFERSLAKYGVEPLILTRFNGLGSKPNEQYKAIKEGLIKTKYVQFVDCWDLFYAEHPDRAIEKFLEFNSPIVFNAEKNCFPHFTKEQYDELNSTDTYRYPNSGVIIGETEAILAELEAMGAPNIQEDYIMENGQYWHQNDQKLWLDHILHTNTIALDYKQYITQTLHDVNIGEFEETETGFKNKETGNICSIFHANGNGKSSGVKEPILQKLNLL